MEVLYFSRVRPEINWRETKSYDCFFIPERDDLFVREGYHGIVSYRRVTEGEILDEARSLAKGVDPYEAQRRSGDFCPEFSDHKRFEHDQGDLLELFDGVSGRDSFQSLVESRMDALMEKAVGP
ncbi:hypothetical protein CMI42_05310 [Candidatus Pacearchaeota archaeon]|nr:hypothetical protein [Candidatus Pacearchaeota archaeon]|tara:strand:- start:1859 stop:2230 length:372 start_codon:yes stop_codon:yes gene_type:complete